MHINEIHGPMLYLGAGLLALAFDWSIWITCCKSFIPILRKGESWGKFDRYSWRGGSLPLRVAGLWLIWAGIIFTREHGQQDSAFPLLLILALGWLGIVGWSHWRFLRDLPGQP